VKRPLGERLYEKLDSSMTSTKAQLKRQYLRLAKKYHPDKNKSPYAKQMMEEINEAWEILSDDEMRAEYDRIHAPSSNHKLDDPVQGIIRDVWEAAFKKRKGAKHVKH
jgi:DnaJ-class molecular chaperone